MQSLDSYLNKIWFQKCLTLLNLAMIGFCSFGTGVGWSRVGWRWDTLMWLAFALTFAWIKWSTIGFLTPEEKEVLDGLKSLDTDGGKGPTSCCG